MSDYDILMMEPLPPLVMDGVGAIARLHKIWEAPDQDIALKSVAPLIRAIATGSGHKSLTSSFLAQFPKLEIIASFSVGYDHVDVEWARAHGVIVTHTPDVLDNEVADTAMGLLLCAVRQLPQADRFLRAGCWASKPFTLTASLSGRTMGILGLGRIGRAIAKRAEAFGLKVVYHGRHQQADAPYLYIPTLVELAQNCDILVSVVPGGAATYKIINAEVLEALGPNGVFINIGRGSAVDEEALIAALKTKKILTAGLDVFQNEPNVPQALKEMDHVVLLPHVGSGTNNTRDAMGKLVVDNIASFMRGTGPLTPVAETPWPSRGTGADAQ